MVALAQMVATLVFLGGAKAAGLLSFPDTNLAVLRQVFPLPLIFILNLLTGLASTKALKWVSGRARSRPAALTRRRPACP